MELQRTIHFLHLGLNLHYFCRKVVKEQLINNIKLLVGTTSIYRKLNDSDNNFGTIIPYFKKSVECKSTVASHVMKIANFEDLRANRQE